MKPILFPKTATTFNTNGLGRLDAISCIVMEERNGIFELEMEIAETSAHAGEIEADSIIVAKPNQSDNNQAFRVYKITKPINGRFTVLARHISYQLNVITTMPFSVNMSSGACASTLAGLKTNAVQTCPFDFTTDVTTVAAYNQTTPASIRNRIGGTAGSVLDQFGGELKWDNFHVYLYKNRGVTTPQVTLRYGKNITDINQEENIENTITGIVPFWTDAEGGELVTLTEKVVEISSASSFPYKKTIPYDFSQDFDEKPTELQLRAKAQAYLNTSGLGVPKVSIKLSFVNLSDTEDYKDIASLQTVNLCDLVGVQFEKLGINTTAEVIRTDYDVLNERYTSIQIGSLRSTLVSTISGTMNDVKNVYSTTQDMIKNSSAAITADVKDYADDVAGTAESNAKDYVDTALNDYYTQTQTNNAISTSINTATAWLTDSNGYVMAVKDNNGNWKEIIFADHNDPDQWHNVLRINENGIGFSSDGGTTYTQAWTLDGKIVIGGTNVPSLTVYDANDNVLFQVSENGTVWNSTKSSMTADGTLTARSANITGLFKSFSVNSDTVVEISDVSLNFSTYPSVNTEYVKHVFSATGGTGGGGILNITAKDCDYFIAATGNDISLAGNNIKLYGNITFDPGTGSHINVKNGSNSYRGYTGQVNYRKTTGSGTIDIVNGIVVDVT